MQTIVMEAIRKYVRAQLVCDFFFFAISLEVKTEQAD
tara:strand:- start:116 stop:226 length:111 start_codon:yes stop_codon:yes gene_type:complete